MKSVSLRPQTTNPKCYSETVAFVSDHFGVVNEIRKYVSDHFGVVNEIRKYCQPMAEMYGRNQSNPVKQLSSN